jgi:hypothetical protein
MQAEPEPGPVRRGDVPARPRRVRRSRRRLHEETSANPSSPIAAPRRAEPPQLRGQDVACERPRALPVPPAALRVGRGQDDRDGRHAVTGREREPAASAVGVEPQAVDDRRQPAPQPRLDDRVEHGERVGRGGEVVLGLPHHPPQPVARDDRSGREALRRPGALAGRRRADQHHERRPGEVHAAIVHSRRRVSGTRATRGSSRGHVHARDG